MDLVLIACYEAVRFQRLHHALDANFAARGRTPFSVDFRDLLAEREGQDIAVFGPRSSTGAIVESIERIVAERDAVVLVGPR